MRTKMFLAGIACFNVFQLPPNSELWAKFRAAQPEVQPSAVIPAELEAALEKDRRAGYHLIDWEPSPAGQGYIVDLYHPAPGTVSERDDFQRAAALGRGLAFRKFVRTLRP